MLLTSSLTDVIQALIVGGGLGLVGGVVGVCVAIVGRHGESRRVGRSDDDSA
jgi:hypothetical protein